MSLFLLLAAAHAGELNFSPDRPGLGDSTAAVGAGHLMVEGGFSGTFVARQSSFGLGGVVGRFGVIDPVEVRLRLPDLNFSNGVGGNLGLGAKAAVDISDSVAASVVPELLIGVDGQGVGFSLGGQGSWSAESLGLWVHANVTAQGGGTGGIVGGGASYGVGHGGFYANAGVAPGAALGVLVGGGGWYGFTPAFQMDAGIDVMLVGGITAVTPMLGASGGF